MKITQIVALVSATAFILTVAYIYGFSRSIEVNLLTYFSTNDYIKFSVHWLPRYIVPYGIGFCMAKMTPPFFGIGSSYEDKIAKYPDSPAFVKFVLKHEEKIMYIVVIGTSVGCTLFLVFRFVPEHALYICYYFVGIGLWIVFFSYFLKPGLAKEEWIIWKQKAVLLGPILIVLVYIYGIFAGISELAKVDKYSTEQIEMTSEVSNKKGRVLFALSQYIVFLEQKTKTVDIIPVGQVKNIITIPKNKSKEKKNEKKLEEAKKEKERKGITK